MSEQYKITQTQRNLASQWFSNLGSNICQEFENVEAYFAQQTTISNEAGKFQYVKTRRSVSNDTDAGGGTMGRISHGIVFEKVSVNISTVFGNLTNKMLEHFSSKPQIANLSVRSKFWASGLSLVAHMQNPRVPSVHFNTRMFWTPSRWWFGGAFDLNPCIVFNADTEQFHNSLRMVCDKFNPEYYTTYKKWADQYFFITHRNCSRGVGGIFFDDLNSGNWKEDFNFICELGRSFVKTYIPLIEKRHSQNWTPEEKHIQLRHRARYVEFNLLYDRGTRFGLASGHEPDATLMSMPPLAAWD